MSQDVTFCPRCWVLLVAKGELIEGGSGNGFREWCLHMEEESVSDATSMREFD